MWPSREWKWNGTTSTAEPIFDLEAGHLPEIAEVGREERCSIGQGDCRDARIPRSDPADQMGREVAHHVGGGLIEGQDASPPGGIIIQESTEPLEFVDLFVDFVVCRIDPTEAFGQLIEWADDRFSNL